MAVSWSMVSTLYRHCGINLRTFKRKTILRYDKLGVHRIPDSSASESRAYYNFLPTIVSAFNQDVRSFSSVNKDCKDSLAKTHEPSEVEKDWYELWHQHGYFNSNINKDSKGTFSLLLPPPNVTGTLHLGHALTGAIQDALVRWHRMKGDKVLWVPGTDHAGIATHAVVEKKLWREQGKTRHDLGRDQFVQEVWKWKTLHGDVINKQMKTLGLSLDWSRQYFTMDEQLSAAVTEAFCRLFEKGLIYSDKRMINWSCAMQSSLSDIEVEYIKLEQPTFLKVPGLKEMVEFGLLTSFAYPVENSDETIVVSTTRLETMLADTAVAVHPQDSRYSHLVGRQVKHPIDSGRLLPIIADDFVDMSFGTGAVKITPGHDYTDYEVGRRHDLPVIEMLADDGTLLPYLPLAGGQHRLEARDKVREALCLLGLYHGQKPHLTMLPRCSRSGDVVEPRLKSQWFLDCKNMALAASQAVKDGKLKLVPEFHEKIWDEWLLNTRDWCLSRQLWWGHRIPVYSCLQTGHTVCAASEEEAKQKLVLKTGKDQKDIVVTQDEDVLDTWFSSALLPFSALGWPHKTRDLDEFFPQQLLETGQDILFFWVARMVMLSLELTGELPFSTVLLHGMVRDAHGRKMSKSLGNVIDPLDVVNGISLQDLHKRLEQGNLDPSELNLAKAGQKKDFPNGIPACGSDALRFTLCSYNIKNMDINFDITLAESRKKFCNKIWQSFKFVQSKLPSDFVPQRAFEFLGSADPTDLWILSRLSHMVHSCETHFQSYDLHLVTSGLQQFWYQEFCDVYLEAVKPVFVLNQGDKQHINAVCQILHLCTETFLRAAAPFMPFLCEELYQHLPLREEEKASSVHLSPYPLPEQYPWRDEDLECSMEKVRSIASHILRQRKEYNIMGSKSLCYIQSDDPDVPAAVQRHRTCLLALSHSGDLNVLSCSQPSPQGCSSDELDGGVSVYVELKGRILDVEKELKGLAARRLKLESNRHKLSEQLDKLVAKGKGEITKAVNLREKLMSIEDEQSKVAAKIQTLKDISPHKNCT